MLIMNVVEVSTQQEQVKILRQNKSFEMISQIDFIYKETNFARKS